MSSFRKQSGITLIEVLVAIVVMALGLIGIAALQSTAIQNNQLAYEYTLAATASQSMVESMRGNRQAVVDGLYDFATGVPNSPPRNCVGATASCSAQQKAQWDLALWYASFAANHGRTNLPDLISANQAGVRVRIDCGAASTCTATTPRYLTLFWDSRRSGATGLGCNPQNNDDLVCYQLPYYP